jgi:hypothetical protein
MNQREKSFMAQFDAAKKDGVVLRSVMGESARMATLSYPVSVPIAASQPVKTSPAKKKVRRE